MKPLRCSLLTAFLALAANGAFADSAAFEQANKLYEEGHYVEAIDAYQDLLTNSPTVALHFNLGNAWFKSGQIGEAIAEYRRAQNLAPRDPDVRANLKFARARVTGPSYRSGWLQQKLDSLSSKEWIALTTAAIWSFFGLLAARQLRPDWRHALRLWTFLTGVLAAVLLTATIWVAKSRANTHVVVIVPRETIMRRGPFDESQSALNLKMGTELRVLDSKNGWLQVTPDGRQTGWITNEAARMVQ